MVGVGFGKKKIRQLYVYIQVDTQWRFGDFLLPAPH
jgi:hypothetical protein